MVEMELLFWLMRLNADKISQRRQSATADSEMVNPVVNRRGFRGSALVPRSYCAEFSALKPPDETNYKNVPDDRGGCLV
jgi:hypothetical protein